MTKYSSSAAWCLLPHITPRQQRAAARTPPFIKNHQWAAVASTHWRQLERRCLEMRRYSGCWLLDNTRLWRLWWLSIYPGLQDTPHLGPEEAAHYSHTGAPLDNFTIILLVLMKATYKCLQEGRHCTRANTGNKQRAQCWSASAAALLSTKQGI